MKKLLTTLAFSVCCLACLAQNQAGKTWWQKIKEASEQRQHTEVKAEPVAEPVTEPVTEPAVETERINVTLLLPFAAVNKPNSIAFNFYSGVLLAARELGDKGIGIKLNVFDSEDGYFDIDNDDLDNADILLGPISGKDIKRIAYRKPDGKYLISPLEPSVAELTDSMNVIQTPLPWKKQIQQLTRWACEQTEANDSLIIVKESGAQNLDCYLAMEGVISDRGAGCTVLTCNAFEDLKSLFSQFVSASGTTRFLLASEKEEFSSRVIEVIGSIAASGSKVATFCPSKIRSFNSIDDKLKQAAGVNMVAGYYIDRNAYEVKMFESEYQRIYKCKPTQFAYHGYDLTKYFVELCHKEGKDWIDKLESCKKQGLQTNFDFVREENAKGFVNQGFRQITR